MIHDLHGVAAGTLTVVAVLCLSLPQSLSDPADVGAVGVATVPAMTLRTPRPNVVVVMADDMRVDDLRFMPHVRRLIRDRGLTYRNSFSPYPLCCPARASFLTGQYPHNHGVLSNVPPWGFPSFDDRHTLATSLQASGYRTAFVGKYLNLYGATRSLVTGRMSTRYVPAGWTHWAAAVQVPAGSRLHGGTYDYFDTPFNIDGHVVTRYQGQYQTTVLGRLARSVVRADARSGRPFFLWLSALAPHTGDPVERDDRAPMLTLSGHVLQLPTPARPDWVKGRFDASVRRAPGLPLRGGQPEADVGDKPWRLRRPPLRAFERRSLLTLTRQRAESLSVLDREVARLVGTLRDTGQLSRTVLVFTSDNGYFLGEHRFRSAKTLAYEPALRVPLFIAGPHVPVGQRFEPAMPVDLTATVLDLADASPPHRADGVSLVPGFTGRLRGWTRPVVTEGIVRAAGPRRDGDFADARNTIGIRTARYQLTRWANGAVELYDLRRDPNELVNRARDPSYRSVRRDLERVWTARKDCAGTTCAAPLPRSLGVPAGRLVRLTEHESRGVRARFGFGW